jgi:hypothetical protein
MRERKLKISESKSTKQTESFDNLISKHELMNSFGSISLIKPSEVEDVYSARNKQVFS